MHYLCFPLPGLCLPPSEGVLSTSWLPWECLHVPGCNNHVSHHEHVHAWCRLFPCKCFSHWGPPPTQSDRSAQHRSSLPHPLLRDILHCVHSQKPQIKQIAWKTREYTANSIPRTFGKSWWDWSLEETKWLYPLYPCFQARRVIGDFAVPIAIFIMVLLDYFLKDTYTEVSAWAFLGGCFTGEILCVYWAVLLMLQKLDVPGGLVPTDASKRGWFISPLGSSEKALPVWGMFFAIVPSMLVYILIFMETELTTWVSHLFHDGFLTLPLCLCLMITDECKITTATCRTIHLVA